MRIDLQIYPIIFTGVALGQLIIAGTDVFIAWSRAVRDREYLVELRLRNFDQQKGAGGAEGDAEERTVLRRGMWARMRLMMMSWRWLRGLFRLGLGVDEDG